MHKSCMEKVIFANYETQPQNPDAKIWRYMDLAKFLSLLDSSSLYLCRADRLNDHFEGASTKANITVRENLIKDFKTQNEISISLKKIITWAYINCWHMNEFESNAMWKLYGINKEAIAIQTTYKKLADQVDDSCGIARVIYLDDEKKHTPEIGDFRARFLFKKIDFEHEKEIRLIKIDSRFPQDIDNENTKLEENIPIDLTMLIENIYISPLSSDWFKIIIGNLLKKYGLPSIKVIRSNLSDSPIY